MTGGTSVSMAELQTGRFKYNDGGWYVGQHCGDGKRHGQGIYTYPNGDVFDGSFIMGKCVSGARPCLPTCQAAGARLRPPSSSRCHRGSCPGHSLPPGDCSLSLAPLPGGKEQAPTSIRQAAGTRANGKTIAW